MSAAKVVFDDAGARARIRDSLDESLLVEAAAGTGKTTELVTRMVNLLASGRARVERIAAVTFTHKAAGELKLRLREGLDQRLREAPPDESANLADALGRLEEASIGTIHGFCAQILRERPVEARVDPAFAELDEGAAGRLREEAFQRWFEHQLNQDSPALRRALARFVADERLEVGSLRKAARELLEWRDYPGEWTRPDWNREQAIRELAGVVREAGAKVNTIFRDVITAAREIERIERLYGGDLDAIEGLLLKLNRDLKRQHKKGLEQLQFALARFKESADASLAAELRDEFQPLIDRYEAIKQRRGGVDFLDLLIRARDLVRDDAGVRAHLQQRFTHLFIDEFQDTDPVQAELLLLLACEDPREADWRKARPAPGKLFAVGDPKQSIYKFRRADVSLYREVARHLQDSGVGLVYLTRSFRSTRPIQEFVNHAFAPQMGEGSDHQAAYVPLEGGEPAHPDQPSVIALPIPDPYNEKGNPSGKAIEANLPGAVTGLIEWLLTESGWTVRDPSAKGERVPLEASHICILFRRFVSWGSDGTRLYARGLEERGIPHVLVGSKSFHAREEVETIRAALNAIEWPDDELSVFAALKGSLFAISDAALLEYRSLHRRLHPLHVPEGEAEGEQVAIRESLALLRDLHRARNRRPAAETVNALLEAVRAHAGFAMRPAGHLVLANVERLIEMARAYEQSQGGSFRGFVEELESAAESHDTSESPILEAGASGVRIMTAHKAKGLEFPVVILADVTTSLYRKEPERFLDPARRLCAMRLLGCAPLDLLLQADVEVAREKAEGIRIAYVAATRARDLLVIPGIPDDPLRPWRIGDAPYWLSPLDSALYPAPGEKPLATWWSLSRLKLHSEAPRGIRDKELLEHAGVADEQAAAYQRWREDRAIIAAAGQKPSLRLILPHAAPAADRVTRPVETILLPRDSGRPTGGRFGELVHALLLRGDPEGLAAAASLQARVLGATDREVAAAILAVERALASPLLQAARQADLVLRESPISARLADGAVLDGVIDLAFRDANGWTVVDFKTSEDLEQHRRRHEAQLGLYAEALERTAGGPVRAVLLGV
jgi:ATP-dependent helicase/nuclease subunit A